MQREQIMANGRTILKRFLAVFLVIQLLFSLQITHAYASEKGKVIIFVMDRTSWEDIRNANAPNIKMLSEKGGIGLMTNNTAGSNSQKNAYITIGAGALATGSAKSHLAFDVNELFQGQKISDLYYQNTGNIINPNSNIIVNLGIAQVYRNNRGRNHHVNIGALGTALKEAGINIAVYGNCDTSEEPKRYLASMMMDNEGVVPYGNIGRSMLRSNSQRPFGISTDYNKMGQDIYKEWNNVDVIAVQLGDTSRVEDFYYDATDEMLLFHKKRSIEEGDQFLGTLLKKIDLESDLFIMLTPLASKKELGRNNRLTPIIIAGKNIKSGWLTSGSTHRRGVVTNLDVGITILSFFNRSPVNGQTGAKIFSIDEKGGIDDLIRFNDKLVNIYNQRFFLIRSYIFLQIIVLGLALWMLLFKRVYLKLISFLLYFLMTVPISFLLMGLFHPTSLAGSVLIILSFSGILTYFLLKLFQSTTNRIAFVCIVMVLTLAIDQWTGAKMIQSSPLGYDVIIGARFYGIGNEYMGIFVGAVCTGSAALMASYENKKKMLLRLNTIFYIIALWTLASPWLGANVGGTISAFIAFSVTILIISGHRIKIKHAVAITATLILLIIGLFFVDSLKASDVQSHMGKTVTLVQQNGLSEMFIIFKRKISTNLRLIRYTIWTRVLLASLAAIAILFYRPVGIFKDVIQDHKILVQGMAGATVGSITALLVNDSGIVAAATAMIYVAPPFILLIIDQVQKNESGEWNL